MDLYSLLVLVELVRPKGLVVFYSFTLKGFSTLKSCAPYHLFCVWIILLLGVVACLCFSQILSRGKGVDLGHNHIAGLSFPIQWYQSLSYLLFVLIE